MWTCHGLAALAAVAYAAIASGQNLQEQVWGVFAYTVHGDSVPSLIDRPKGLTPYGANNLRAAGSAFRNRYVAVGSSKKGPDMRIQNMSPYLLESADVDILSTTDYSTVASAQAFMQGLYPPLNDSFGGRYYDDSFVMANGSRITAPLNGYQYPQIIPVGNGDPASIIVDGQAQCEMHQAFKMEYKSSPEAQDKAEMTAAFYDRLYERALSGVLERSAANYINSTEISEYLDYQLLHNKTLLNHLNREDVEKARSLADQFVFTLNGDTSSKSAIGSGFVRTIAGRTLASQITNTFNMNIATRGTGGKMSLIFGGNEPAVALSALMQLASKQHQNFYSRPNLGASLLFELFSLEKDANPTYPDPSQLHVRFYLRNGTESPDFQSYPLFGLGPSNDAMPYSEFQSRVAQFSLGSAREWCLRCNSNTVFCNGAVGHAQTEPAPRKGPSAPVAGVIGGVIVLVIEGAIWALVCMVLAIRKTRSRRKSSLGGFKGDKKMASDCDVTFNNPIWGDGKVAGPQDESGHPTGGVVVRGHERMGSWEMSKPQGGGDGHQQSVSPFGDEHEEEWETHSGLKPVVARESV